MSETDHRASLVALTLTFRGRSRTSKRGVRLMSIKVAVTEPEFNKAQKVFAHAAEQGWQCVPAPQDEPALAAVLRHNAINYAIVGTLGYRGALYEALPPGGVIARFGV